MHWTQEIATFLETQSVGTLGTDLFWGVLPDRPVSCGAVIPYAGMAPQAEFGANTVAFERPRAQVVWRGPVGDVNTALTKMQTAFEALCRTAVTLSGGLYYRIMPLQSPYLRGYSVGGSPEVAFNIEVERER